jgi:hypothetical protein
MNSAMKTLNIFGIRSPQPAPALLNVIAVRYVSRKSNRDEKGVELRMSVGILLAVPITEGGMAIMVPR